MTDIHAVNVTSCTLWVSCNLISEILGAEYFRFEGKRPGWVNGNFRYREEVSYWITGMCVSVCSVY